MSGSSSIGGKGPAGDVSFNYVPLIDVTFNLIIFFVLTSEIANTTLARVLIASPEHSEAAQRDKAPNNVVINVVSQATDKKDADPQFASHALQYEVDGTVVPIGDLDKLVDTIKARRAQYQKLLTGAMAGKGEFFVEIRADFRIDYSEVKPVMVAIAKAGVQKMAITAKMK